MHKRERKKKLILTLKNNAKLREEHSTKVGNEHLTAKTLWGRLVIYLREHNQVILHIVCGDIENVKYDGDTLIISPEQKNVVDLLNEKNNYDELKKALAFMGQEKFEIKLDEKVQKIEENIKTLKKYFSNVNIIKGDNKNE